jgi:hypothetical protein
MVGHLTHTPRILLWDCKPGPAHNNGQSFFVSCFMFIISSGSFDPDFTYHMPSHSFWYITPLFHQDLFWYHLIVSSGSFDPDSTYHMVSHSLYNWTFDIDLTYLIVTPHRRHCITVSVLDKYTLVLSTAGPTTQWGWIRQQPSRDAVMITMLVVCIINGRSFDSHVSLPPSCPPVRRSPDNSVISLPKLQQVIWLMLVPPPVESPCEDAVNVSSLYRQWRVIWLTPVKSCNSTLTTACWLVKTILVGISNSGPFDSPLPLSPPTRRSPDNSVISLPKLQRVIWLTCVSPPVESPCETLMMTGENVLVGIRNGGPFDSHPSSPPARCSWKAAV